VWTTCPGSLREVEQPGLKAAIYRLQVQFPSHYATLIAMIAISTITLDVSDIMGPKCTVCCNGHTPLGSLFFECWWQHITLQSSRIFPSATVKLQKSVDRFIPRLSPALIISVRLLKSCCFIILIVFKILSLPVSCRGLFTGCVMHVLHVHAFFIQQFLHVYFLHISFTWSLSINSLSVRVSACKIITEIKQVTKTQF